MRRHTGETPYECRICNARFASNGGMKVHVRNKHDKEPKKSCPMPGCDKSFTTIGNMKVGSDNHFIQQTRICESMKLTTVALIPGSH